MQKLKFYKTVLEKVSFSRVLYVREYNKAMQGLPREERAILSRWSTRYHHHPAQCLISLDKD